MVDPADHVRLAKWVLARFLQRTPAACRCEDDLIGAAYEGLCLAARRYDPSRGSFANFVVPSIDGALVREWFRLRLPVRRAYGAYRESSPVVLSFSGPAAPGYEERLEEVLPADGPSPEDLALLSIEAGEVLAALNRTSLTRREKYIIIRRKLIPEPLTLAEIGKGLHLTRERVRQLEKQALEKLRADP